MGTFSCLGGITALFLPETLWRHLPNTLAEGEGFGSVSWSYILTCPQKRWIMCIECLDWKLMFQLICLVILMIHLKQLTKSLFSRLTTKRKQQLYEEFNNISFNWIIVGPDKKKCGSEVDGSDIFCYNIFSKSTKVQCTSSPKYDVFGKSKMKESFFGPIV